MSTTIFFEILNYWPQSKLQLILIQVITHYCPAFPFYTPENLRFSDVFRGIKREHRAVMGYSFFKAKLGIPAK